MRKRNERKDRAVLKTLASYRKLMFSEQPYYDILIMLLISLISVPLIKEFYSTVSISGF